METKPKILIRKGMSKNAAKRMLFSFARWGDHHYKFLRDLTDSELISVMKHNNYDLKNVINDLSREFNKKVPLFENLYDGSSYSIASSGAGVLKGDVLVGGVSLGAAEVNKWQDFRVPYLADFIYAGKARDRAIKDADFNEFLTMIIKGFSCLEGYMNMISDVHNYSNKKSAIDKTKIIPLEDKIKQWIPRIAPGVELGLGASKAWQKLIRLKAYREHAVHPKPGFNPPSVFELGSLLNDSSLAFGETLFMLHRSVGSTVPSKIIRFSCSPEIYTGGC